MKEYIIINELDNVAVALKDLPKDWQQNGIKTLEEIPHNFKFAAADINCGQDIIKYGNPIGAALKDIKKGELVHIHNMATKLGRKENYDSIKIDGKKTQVSASALTFKAYNRLNGKIGIRNDIFIIPTVGCVNNLCEKIAKEAIAQTGYENIFATPHPYGCSQLGKDHENTQKILSKLATHPNAGGVLIVSLGCENNNLKEFLPYLGEYDKGRIRHITAQELGDEVAQSVQIVKDLYSIIKNDKKEDIPISKLIIGLKCGGSDALSGITANPLIGQIADKLLSLGASAILTEVPEMFGAEHILMQRSGDKKIFDSIVSMIDEFKEYFLAHGEEISKNPSPGNIEGGITTLEEKSLGCIQKGGSGTIIEVLKYGESASKKGLILLDCPGNDIVAQTALTAAGAHIILFSTGRGTPLGAPVPTIKISTNDELSAKKPNWIDFNAGELLNSKTGDLQDRLFDLILKVAEGQSTKNEINGYRDIAIWKTGVTL